MQLLALGMFVFSIQTAAFADLQRRMDWIHAKSGRVGTRDATQFVGPGDETISLKGTIFAELADPRESLDQLRDMADQGEAWALVDGTGRVWGSYVITALDERQAELLPDGTPQKVEFSLDLLRVDNPEPAQAGQTEGASA